MVIFLEVHIQICIFHRLVGAEILGIGFLHQGITTVFFVSEDAADSTGRPAIVAHRGFNPLFGQCSRNLRRRSPFQTALVDVLNNPCLGRLNDQPAKVIAVETQRILYRKFVNSLSHTPANTRFDGLAFLLGLHLGQRRQKNDQQIVFSIARVGDVLCLKFH